MNFENTEFPLTNQYHTYIVKDLSNINTFIVDYEFPH